MSSLPRADEALIDLRKLTDYILDPTHPRGRHKARVLAASLGLARGDALWLRDVILSALPMLDAVEEGSDRFGTRWRADLPIRRGRRSATVRTHWLVAADGSPPRLITCYVR